MQFIPAYNRLVEVAVEQAQTIGVDGEPARIISAEHLIAILLQTYRGKDKQRVILLIEQAEYDEEKLRAILREFDLEDRWNDFKERFL